MVKYESDSEVYAATLRFRPRLARFKQPVQDLVRLL